MGHGRRRGWHGAWNGRGGVGPMRWYKSAGMPNPLQLQCSARRARRSACRALHHLPLAPQQVLIQLRKFNERIAAEKARAGSSPAAPPQFASSGSSGGGGSRASGKGLLGKDMSEVLSTGAPALGAAAGCFCGRALWVLARMMLHTPCCCAALLPVRQRAHSCARAHNAPLQTRRTLMRPLAAF